jgi:hypothetical protein
MNTGQRGRTEKRERERAGVVCALAAIVSRVAVRHQYWAQHELLFQLFWQSEDANKVV